MRQLVTPVTGPLKGEVEKVDHNSQTTETPSQSLGRVQKETITMATLTIILLVSTAFALGDATIRPMTPCERARYAATHGPIGAYIPTCDDAGRYTLSNVRDLQVNTDAHTHLIQLNVTHTIFTHFTVTCLFLVGYCWCVTTTGQKIQGTDTPPGTAINC
uniref:Thyroglobulin type-1 domain-containing protein n=1 Tax=Oncorhynchus mykiss TaxID=8022 RepID=A0A8C7RUU6_ONCMY